MLASAAYLDVRLIKTRKIMVLIIIVCLVGFLLYQYFHTDWEKVPRSPEPSYLTGPNPYTVVCCDSCGCEHHLTAYEHGVLSRNTRSPVGADCVKCGNHIRLILPRMRFAGDIKDLGKPVTFTQFKEKKTA